MLPNRMLSTDVLVVGGGGAGTLAAIKAMEAGAKVLVVTKGPFPAGNTAVARAGFTVALGYADPRDNPQVHFEDILRVGNGLNNRKLVRAWVNEIVDVTREMDKWGMDFIKKEGKLDQKGAPDHTYARNVHHHDTTGNAIVKCLRKKSQDLGIQALEHTIVGGLFQKDGKIIGAWGINDSTGEPVFINAKAVVLATGGLGQLYTISDSVNGITGEGYAIAFRAGAELVDMEMTDFQLTTCYPEKMKGYACHAGGLISMGGAKLYNGLGERFMKKYYPNEPEKVRTRAEYSCCVGLEIYEGRTTPHGGVFLDTSDIAPELQKLHFPVVWHAFKQAGVDLSYQPMEVVPNAHTFLGGLRIDETCGTNIAGLFGAGEAAGGIHGASRTNGGALSAILAFGSLSGKSAARYARQVNTLQPLVEKSISDVQRRLESLISKSEGISPAEIRASIQKVADKYLSVVRDEAGLKKAFSELQRIEQEDIPRMHASNRTRGQAYGLREAIEIDGQLELAKIIATAAMCRKESRGGHYRKDYPAKDDNNWLKNVVLKRDDKGISSFTIPIVTE